MTTVARAPRELSHGERIQQRIQEITDGIKKDEEKLKKKKKAANKAILTLRAKCGHTGPIRSYIQINSFHIRCEHCGKEVWVLPFAGGKENWPADVRQAYDTLNFIFFLSKRYRKAEDDIFARIKEERHQPSRC